MANKIWQEFLKQKNYQNTIIKESVLESVVVTESDNSVVLTVKLRKSLPYTEFNKFIEDVKLFFKTDSFEKFWIDFKYDDPSIGQYHKDYYQKIVRRLEKENQSSAELNTCQCDYENKDGKNIFKIIVDKDSTGISDRYFDKIKEAFKTYGFDVELILEVDHTKESIKEKMIKAQKAETEKAQKELELQRKEQAKVERRQLKYKSSKGYKKVKLSEIPNTQYQLDQYKNENGEPNFVITGKIESIELRELKTTNLLQILLVDKNDAIYVKQFLRDKEISDASAFGVGDVIEVQGYAQYDTYASDVVFMSKTISLIEENSETIRKDFAKEKRIEFGCHTKMSNLDGIATPAEYINIAKSFGHKAVGFTDINALFAYPEISREAKNANMKAIYGLEVNFIDEDNFKAVSSKDNFNFDDADFVVFDVETTGLSQVYDEIIEIGAIKVSKGVSVSSFNEFIKPKQKIEGKIFELTNINPKDIESAKSLSEVFPKFLDFIKGSVLVAHNASFDIGFLKAAINELELKKRDFSYIDTLNLARVLYSDKLKRFNLKALTNFLKVSLDEHHRAISDAKATADAFLIMINDLRTIEIRDAHSLRNHILKGKFAHRFLMPERIKLLAKNEKGCKDIYRLISYALTDYYVDVPKLPKSILDRFRENILVGGGNWEGPVFKTAFERLDSELEETIKYFDFVEISPDECYLHLIERSGETGKERIADTRKRIVKYSEKNNVIVIASSDPYYIDREDTQYRNVYIRTPRVGGGLHSLRFDEVKPINYFMTTEEMLNKFPELPLEKVYAIVVKNSEELNNKIEDYNPFNDTLHSLPDNVFSDNLKIASLADEVRKVVSDKMKELYGNSPHGIIKERVSRELKTIIQNNYAPIYYISMLLIQKSESDGYTVGSRGSVGSSIVARLMGVTEVNPLAPHYYCENGCFQLFQTKEEAEVQKIGSGEHGEKLLKLLKKLNKVGSGIDLKKEKCPYCNGVLKGDGNNIPFETFLGFGGEKIPDIDLNFSGEYQPVAHGYVRELLGEDTTFRAGTVLTVKDTAFGYVKGYVEDNNFTFRKAKIEYFANKIREAQRTTSQHPGGIIVVPKSISVYDITPIQYPAADTVSDWKTTHFDYHALENNLLKLDILGHTDPTVIKYIRDYVKENPKDFPFKSFDDIPLNDSKVYTIFAGVEELKLQKEIISSVGSLGVPELGTDFVRQMLEVIKPKNFEELVKVSGLSHGTNVWLTNGDELVRSGKVKFSDIIACRDDIMVVLLKEYGIDAKQAFNIMEFVRKNGAKKNPKKWLEYAKIMTENDVPKWYIDSAQKIEYLFPKAHATAYVISALRIAWFKVYSPLIFYSAYFSIKAVQFEHDIMVSSYKDVTKRLNEILEKIKIKKATPKEIELKSTFEMAQEMLARGYKFVKVDAEKSDATKFIIEGNNLRMPFITVDGLGNLVAEKVVEQRKQEPYKSKADFKKRSGVNATVYEKLLKSGSLDSLVDEVIEEEINLFTMQGK